MQQDKNDALQALRGIAVLLVVLMHSLTTANRPMFEFLQIGDAGVKIFFAISGYIIARSIVKLNPEDAWLFMRRRIIRIVPLYWLFTAVYAATHIGTTSISDLLASMFFIPYLAKPNTPMHPVLGQGWSLNFEMAFYVLAAGVMLFASKRRWFLYLIGPMALFSLLPEPRDAGISLLLLADHRLWFFILGVLIAWANPRISKNLSYDNAVFFMLSWSFLLFLYNNDPQIYRVLQFFTAGLFLYVAVICNNHSATAPGMRPPRTLAAIGDASYSTYLSHGFVLGLIDRTLDSAYIQSNPMVTYCTVILCTVLSIIVGQIVYEFLERPMLQRLNAAFGQRRKPAQQQT